MTAEYRCKTCDYKTNILANLKRHESRLNKCTGVNDPNNKKEYKCDHCQREFTCNSNKFRHMKMCKQKKEQEGKNKEQTSGVNPFGKEDRTFIPKHVILKFLDERGDGIINMARCTHFSRNSEGRNRNLRVLSDSMLMDHGIILTLTQPQSHGQPATWIRSDSERVFKQLFASTYNYLDMMLEDMGPDLKAAFGDKRANEVDAFYERMRNPESALEEYNKIIKGLMIMVLNQDLPIS